MNRLLLIIACWLTGAHAQADIKITDAWYRIPFPKAKVTAAYVTIENTDAQDDELLTVSSDLCETVEIHDMIRDAYGMQMKHLKSLKIPKKTSVELKPSGKHLMLIELNERTIKAQPSQMRFKFKRSGTISIKIKGRKG